MKPTAGRSASNDSWWGERRPIPARAGIGPWTAPRVSRRVIVDYEAFFSGFTTLPPLFSHSPFGVYFQSEGSLSTLAWPAQEWLALPQSFCPALAMPAHFSFAASSPADAVTLPSASRLPTAEAMAMVFRFMRLLRVVVLTTGRVRPGTRAIYCGPAAS